MLLDNLQRGEVVYCRPIEGKFSYTTIARFESREERIEQETDPKTGRIREQVVAVDYALWDLRRDKKLILTHEIGKPAPNAWRTASEYQALRANKKVKIHGDFADEVKKDDEANPKRAKIN